MGFLLCGFIRLFFSRFLRWFPGFFRSRVLGRLLLFRCFGLFRCWFLFCGRFRLFRLLFRLFFSRFFGQSPPVQVLRFLLQQVPQPVLQYALQVVFPEYPVRRMVLIHPPLQDPR